MTTIYETFEELAEAMCKGEGILHMFNCAEHRGVSACVAWQSGVNAFAEWLDHIGCKVAIPDKAEDFYTFSAKKYETVAPLGDQQVTSSESSVNGSAESSSALR